MTLPTSATRQFALTIVAPVRQERVPELDKLLDQIRRETIHTMRNQPVAQPLMPFRAVESIHYARWVLIDGTRAFISGPQLVFSTNYDGPIGRSDCPESEARKRHIAELIEHCQDVLHRIYQTCIGYDLDRDASREDVARCLEQYLTHPDRLAAASTFYVGTSGRSRDQVLAEAALRRDVEAIIDKKQQDPDWPPSEPGALLRDIREAMPEPPPSFPAQPDTVKIWKFVLLGLIYLLGCAALVETWSSFGWQAVWLGVGALMLVMYLAVRAVALALFWPVIVGFLLAGLILPALVANFLGLWNGLQDLGPTVHIAIVLGTVAICVAVSVRYSWGATHVLLPWSLALLHLAGVAALLATPGIEPGIPASSTEWLHAFALLVISVATPGLVLLVLAIWTLTHLERLEERDPVFEPEYRGSELEHIERSSRDENIFFQNQLSNIAVLKPGSFRALIIMGVFYALQLLAITVYNKGKLGDIPTIHFARWVLIDRGRRALFFSNFDSSWQSYLGDFIGKASSGLTAVWSNTVGYPRTRSLLWAGSRDADRFKAWARHQQIPTVVWYSAYPGLSVRNINDNTIIRRGLAEGSQVSQDEWLRALQGRTT